MPFLQDKIYYTTKKSDSILCHTTSAISICIIYREALEYHREVTTVFVPMGIALKKIASHLLLEALRALVAIQGEVQHMKAASPTPDNMRPHNSTS